jgi:hypothetical protein
MDANADNSLLIWWAAIDSGFADEREWVAWADQQIEMLDEPPLWILDLSLVHSRDKAVASISHSWTKWDLGPSESAQRNWLDPMWFGFLFLAFERRNIDLRTLLITAGARADAIGRTPCDLYFMMANEIDGAGPTLPSKKPLLVRVTEHFAPMAKISRHEWAYVWDGFAHPDQDQGNDIS